MSCNRTYGACTRKRRYASRQQALDAAAVISDDCWAYRCVFCNGWHFGNLRHHDMTEEERDLAQALKQRQARKQKLTRASPFDVLATLRARP